MQKHQISAPHRMSNWLLLHPPQKVPPPLVSPSCYHYRPAVRISEAAEAIPFPKVATHRKNNCILLRRWTASLPLQPYAGLGLASTLLLWHSLHPSTSSLIRSDGLTQRVHQERPAVQAHDKATREATVLLVETIAVLRLYEVGFLRRPSPSLGMKAILHRIRGRTAAVP